MNDETLTTRSTHRELLEALGARIVSAEPERLNFRCPVGRGVELKPIDPARSWGLA